MKRITFLWLIITVTLFSCIKKVYRTEEAISKQEVPPVITGFTPDISWYDHIVEINGKNFSKELAENTVRIGMQEVAIVEASTTRLKIRLAVGMQGGYIHVKTNGQETISDRQLIINQLAWQKTIGGSSDEMASAIVPATGGGYIAIGYTKSTDGDITTVGKGGFDMWMAKLDSARQIVWQKSLGGISTDRADAVAATADGGFLVAGESYAPDGDFTGGHGGIDMWVIKMDGNGNVQWKKALGGSKDDYPAGIIAASDGSCIVAGATGSNDGDVKGLHGGGDMWVVKLDANGTLVWQRALGSTGDDYAAAIAWDTDGGCLVAGGTNGKDGDVTKVWGSYDMWAVKLNAAGVTVWQKTLGGTNMDFSSSIVATPDGGSAVIGYTYSTDGDVTNAHGLRDAWVVKLNATGSISWQKNIGGASDEVPATILSTSDGGLVIAVRTSSKDGDISGNHGSVDTWVAKINADKTITGKISLGGSLVDYAVCMTATTDGGYLIAGQTSSTDGDVSQSYGSYDMWLLKVWQ